MQKKIISLALLTICVCTLSASERVHVYWYNATKRPILFYLWLAVPKGNKAVLEPKELSPLRKIEPIFNIDFWYKEGDSTDYGDSPNYWDTFNRFKNQFSENEETVFIFEPGKTDIEITMRALSKKQFDEDYAKALKETQGKYAQEIQGGTPLPPGVCGIVSGYAVDKPK